VGNDVVIAHDEPGGPGKHGKNAFTEKVQLERVVAVVYVAACAHPDKRDDKRRYPAAKLVAPENHSQCKGSGAGEYYGSVIGNRQKDSRPRDYGKCGKQFPFLYFHSKSYSCTYCTVCQQAIPENSQ